MAVDPRDGRLLWSYNKANNGTANVATPIVRGTRVFVSSDYGTGGALLDVRAAGNIATANEVYFTRDMRNHHASLGARRRSPLWIFEQHPDRAEVRYRRDRRGAIAASAKAR